MSENIAFALEAAGWAALGATIYVAVKIGLCLYLGVPLLPFLSKERRS